MQNAWEFCHYYGLGRSEFTGVLPQVHRITDPSGIAIDSSAGSDSLAAKYDLTERLGKWPCVEGLHIEDHDPTDVHLFTSVPRDSRPLVRDLRLNVDIGLSRLAVVPTQRPAPCLPTTPAKPTNHRSSTAETVQWEAIETRLDQNAAAFTLAEEEATRDQMKVGLRPLFLDDPRGVP